LFHELLVLLQFVDALLSIFLPILRDQFIVTICIVFGLLEQQLLMNVK